MPDKSFSSGGGYRWLDAWVLANVIQLGTQRFCRRVLTRTNDPCGRQYDQMTQVARSGVANIAEGYARRATSKETEMRLYDTAKASLDELAGDYRNWLMQKGELPWSESDREEQAVFAGLAHLKNPPPFSLSTECVRGGRPSRRAVTAALWAA